MDRRAALMSMLALAVTSVTTTNGGATVTLTDAWTLTLNYNGEQIVYPASVVWAALVPVVPKSAQ